MSSLKETKNEEEMNDNVPSCPIEQQQQQPHEPTAEAQSTRDNQQQAHPVPNTVEKTEGYQKTFFYEPYYYRGRGAQIYYHNPLYTHSLPCGPYGLHFCPGGIRRYFEMNFLLILPLGLIFELTILEGYKGGKLSAEYISSQVIGAVLILALMLLHLVAAGTDPGIIPPLNVCEPVPEARTIISEDGLEVIQDACKTCRILRPPRSGHCRWCDHCVEMFDHHCGILQVCVAKNNIRYFILWCWTAWITLGFALSRTISIMILDLNWSPDSGDDAGRWRIAACCFFVLATLVCFVIANFPTIHYCRLSGILALEKDIVNDHRVFIDWENRSWKFSNVIERICGNDDKDPVRPSRIPEFVRSEEEKQNDGFGDDEIKPEELPEQLQNDWREFLETERKRIENGGERDSNHV